MSSPWIIVDFLTGVVLEHVQGCVVEIGCGYSSRILAKHAQEADVAFYSCDITPNKIQPPLCDKHKHFTMSSFKFMEEFDDSPAIVLLDGNHMFDVVSREFEFFFSLLLDGGVIFMHDTYPQRELWVNNGSSGDVYRLRQKLEKEPEKLDCFTWPYTADSHGLTMVIKKPVNRPYYRQ